jgi:adenine phosphoribosyltransferase
VTLEQIRDLIRDVPDFPKKGILFKDITPVLADNRAFSQLADFLSEMVPHKATKLAVIESRGFLLGAAIAMKLGLGIVLIRKPGKLPYATLTHSYDLEYGKDSLQMHVDALAAGDRVCIIDDVLATGGTAQAAEVLCNETGAEVVGHVFMMELGFLKGREKLKSKAQSLFLL